MVNFSHNKNAKNKQTEKKHMFFQSLLQTSYFFQTGLSESLYGQNNISGHADSALPSCFGRAHVTDLTTLTWKMECARVLWQRCSSALVFCSDCSE